MGKKELSSLFASNPAKYYKVSLFERLGFSRRKCSKCNKHFWSLDFGRLVCPDHESYSFIGNPPTSRRLDYVGAWKETEKFFRENNHTIVRRYPVVCRWRDDLYFTIASIVDFQRIVGNQIVFELPSNPLVVPQMCLRFNDIENVGVSGRHYTGFCMIGQTCNADARGGYWKDRCIDLDFALLTNGLGIRPEEITFVEDVWMGAGAFGYSLEYFVRGLELGNAVFTEFEGNENNYRVMPNRIIDMGAGLERFAWITMGTPTSYDCCFGPVVKKMVSAAGVDSDQNILGRYFSAISANLDSVNNINELKSLVAQQIGLGENDLSKHITPFEAIYTAADHIRTLVFAISDGALPSNVGGGYNLRVVLRRTLSILERMGWTGIKVEDIAEMHLDYLGQIYPELLEHREDVRTILQLESSRYEGARERMDSIAGSLRNSTKKDGLSVEDLLTLYESDGITPDFLMEQGVIGSIPSNFYTRLAELHASSAAASQSTMAPIEGIENIAATRLLYNEDESMREFSAKALRVIEGKYVILDQTAFYPRGGGQEPDTGYISSAKVTEVTKQANVVVHKVESAASIEEGQRVQGVVNSSRRGLITKHHTATHVLNSSARNNLGSWVWQNSAFKDETYARLDITHHSALTREQVQRIEKTANEVVRRNLPVSIKTYDRGDAEEQFSFRIYQGGVVPSNNVRIVNIEGWDIEACGGTHVSTTGEIGLVKITKSERIQDGVVRLEFVAGEAAIKYVQNQESQLGAIAQALGSGKEKVVESFNKSLEAGENAKRKARAMIRTVAGAMAKNACLQARTLDSGINLYSVVDDELDEEYHIAVGEQAIEQDPSLLYIALIARETGMRVIVLAGSEARKKTLAGPVARSVSAALGGSGGGDARFGQGGGKFRDNVKEALEDAEDLASGSTKQANNDRKT